MNHADWRAAIGGGQFDEGVHAGARCLNLNANPWNANGNVGVRGVCDLLFREGGAVFVAPMIPQGVSLSVLAPAASRAENDRPASASSAGGSPGRPPLMEVSVGTRHKDLIGAIVDWDNLVAAHRLARRGKREREEVASFEAELWENLGALQMEMLWGTYEPGRYRSFLVYEPKRREILAAPYRDRVAQHAICRVCGPIWDRSMIPDSYACRAGKGTHAGANRVQAWLRGMAAGGGWVAKMDVSRYFASIDHGLAKAVLRDKIRCPATLALLDRIVDSTAGTELQPAGIPVGNLTSQWLGNLVLNRVDHWAKRALRLRRYARYMDDMVVVVRSKDEALAVRAEFQRKLDELGLQFSKTSILPLERGVNFLGYRIFAYKRLLRRDSVRRMRRRMRMMHGQYARGELDLPDIRARINSWVAHAAHADSESLRREIISGTRFARAEHGACTPGAGT